MNRRHFLTVLAGAPIVAKMEIRISKFSSVGTTEASITSFDHGFDQMRYGLLSNESFLPWSENGEAWGYSLVNYDGKQRVKYTDD